MQINNLADLTRAHAATTPDNQAMAYVDDGRTWTFRELDSEANRVAQALKAAGVGPGDRIALLDKNAPEYFLYLFGGAKLPQLARSMRKDRFCPQLRFFLFCCQIQIGPL